MSDANQQLIREMHQAMSCVHDSYDTQLMEEIAKIYLECIDKEGFVFDFAHAWKWAGYSTKGNAKRVLLKQLRENTDYKISRDVASSRLIKQDSKGKRGTHGGDRTSEKIMLTARGMNNFCLAAQTDNGVMLRDCIMFLMQGVKKLVQAIRSGEISITRNTPQSTPGPNIYIKGVEQTTMSWQFTREECKELTNLLNTFLARIGGRDLLNKVHSTINRVVAGMSSSRAQAEVEGMRKGETVRNVVPTENLSSGRDILVKLVAWLERLGNEDQLPTTEMVEERLAELCAMHRESVKKFGGLLKHPGAVIHMNGKVNPVAVKRVHGAITNGDVPTKMHELAMTKSSKRRKLNEEERKKAKRNPFAKFGFVTKALSPSSSSSSSSSSFV